MLYIGDFNAQERAITNLKVIANQERKPFWYAYPRWINRESAVVYHFNQTGKRQLYVYVHCPRHGSVHCPRHGSVHCPRHGSRA